MADQTLRIHGIITGPIDQRTHEVFPALSQLLKSCPFSLPLCTTDQHRHGVPVQVLKKLWLENSHCEEDTPSPTDLNTCVLLRKSVVWYNKVGRTVDPEPSS